MPERKPVELVKMMESEEIEIPELQRDFVWSNVQVKDLAESIYNRYPIGTITLYRLPRDLGENPNARYWVLDGQQRLLSLVLITNGSVKHGEGETKDLWIWFNPKEEDYRFTTSPRKLKEDWVCVSEVIKKGREDLLRFTQERSLDERIKIESLWMAFHSDYHVLIHELFEDFDIDKLGDIFVRTNFAGTRVKGAEVYSTMVAVAGKGTVKELKSFVAGLNAKWGWDLDYSVAMRTFIAFLTDGKVKLASRVLDQATKMRKTLESKKNIIPTLLQKAKISIEKAIELLRGTSLAVTMPTYGFLPYQNVLVVMAYYLSKRDPISEEEEKGLLSWYVLASHFLRYSASSETRLNEDLAVIESGKDYRGLVSKLEEYESGKLKERLKEQISRGAWSRLLLYALLKAKRARDLEHPHPELTTADATVHHIFPQAIIPDTQWVKVDDIGNITLTTMGTNTSLRSEKPKDYLKRVPLEVKRAHSIPDNPELWEIENYERFLERRKEMLREAVDSFWENLG